MAEEQVIFRAEVAGEQSITSLRKSIRDMRAEYNGLSESERERRKDLAQNIVATKDYVEKAVQPTLSATARMKNSYFQLGEELRSKTLPVIGQLTNSIQSIPGGFAAVTGRADTMILSMARLSKDVGGLPNAFKAMSAALMGPVGIAAGAAAVIALLPKLWESLDVSGEKARLAALDARKYAQSLVDLRFEIEKIRTGKEPTEKPEELLGRVAVLQAERAKIEREAEKDSKRREDLRRMGSLVEKEGSATKEGKQRVREIDIEILELTKQLALLGKDDLDTQKKITEEKEKQAEAVRRAIFQASGDMLPPTTSPAFEQMQRDMGISGRVGGGSIDVSAAVEGMARARQEAQELNTQLQRGAQNFSSTLINALLHGQNIAQSIGLALLNILVNVGTSYLTGGITSLFSGGSRAGGGGQGPAIIVSQNVTPQGLALVVERGNRINRGIRI